MEKLDRIGLVNEYIQTLPKYEVFDPCGQATSIKLHHLGHSYFKANSTDCYYEVFGDRVFLYKKDFGGTYRCVEIKDADIRLMHAIDKEDFPQESEQAFKTLK